MKTYQVLLLVLLIVVLLVASPLLTIFALNSLFPILAIPYSFWNWLSVIILGGLFKSRFSFK